ncbi:unnamed protein product [Diatraea saccharalis]|uniref:Uncharacterized protein n=1 Tax=Diatraea saccharalis TaxID=40085 RepID=A0A9N9RAX1_9NEOP|nr:unnamed protein product [Diatraea saccharalis]
MRGEEYVGYRKPKGCKAIQDQVRTAKMMGPPCTSSFCQKSKLRGCQRFEEETRKSKHDKFWKTMNWDQRRVYVAGLVTRSAHSRYTKSASETSRREGTFHYYLPIESDMKVQVCKEMFLSTLSLCSTAVQSWVKRAEFATVPSQSVQNEEPTVSRFTFDKEYNKKNLAFYVLKKDMCDTCASYQTGNYDEHTFQLHILKKNRARQEKEADKKLAVSGKLILVTMDLEAVKVCLVYSLLHSKFYIETSK